MRGLRFVVVAASALVILPTGCSQPDPMGVSGDAPEYSLLGDLVGSSGLLHCAPLPADSVAQQVGPAGGTVEVGPHQLVIPPEALPAPVTITAVAPSGKRNRVVFGPEGLTFRQPASLTLSYSNCSLLGPLLPKRVAYVNDDLGILEYLESLDDWLSQSVTAPLDHFSNYAVAW